MILKSGTIVPFICNDVKKLIAIPSLNKNEKLQINDIQTAIYLAFEKLKNKCEFYNLKIGFQIPEELFIPYLEQCHDINNFVVKIHETDEIRDEESMKQEQDPLPDEPQTSKFIENKRHGNDSDASPKEVKKLKLDSIDPHLENILKISTKGQAICRNFELSNELSEEDRLALVRLVMNYEFKNLVKCKAPIVLDTKRLEHLSDAIVRRFPSENYSTYFVEHSKSFKYIAGGKLYEHFLEKRLQYSLQMERNYRYPSFVEGGIEDDFPELEELEEIDTTVDWPTFFRAWKYTFDLRTAYFRNASSFGYFEDLMSKIHNISRINDLVEYDFERLHPKKSNNLLNNWDQLSERIFTEAFLVGRKGVYLILDLYGHMSELSGCMMLSYFYENFEREVRPFDQEYTGNLVIHIETIQGDNPEAFFSKYYFAEEPTVFALGKIEEELSYYVVYGTNSFRIDSVLKAIDFCFKCYRIMQLPYCSMQLRSWKLIQNAFYEIYTDDCIASEKILKLFKNYNS